LLRAVLHPPLVDRRGWRAGRTRQPQSDGPQIHDTQEPGGWDCDEDMPFMDTTTSLWSDTKTSFKYGKLIYAH
jgi:hypothetical protein